MFFPVCCLGFLFKQNAVVLFQSVFSRCVLSRVFIQTECGCFVSVFFFPAVCFLGFLYKQNPVVLFQFSFPAVCCLGF